MGNILQAPILTDYLYPFLLMFFILFAILEKTKILGDNRHQLNAGVSLVVGLIFVSAVFPKLLVSNLLLFLSVGLIVILVGLLLWGFIAGEGGVPISGKMKTFLAIIVVIAVVFAIIGFSGFGGGIENIFTNIFKFLFDSSWSGAFWTNAIIIVLIIGAILVAVGVKVKSG